MSRRGLAADALITQTGRVLQIAFGIAAFVVLARALGVREFGAFSTIVAVQTACYAAADLGLGQLALRAIAQQDSEQAAAIRAVTPWLYASSSVVLGLSCVLSLLLVGGDTSRIVPCLLVGASYIHAPARIGVERGFWLGALQFGRATLIDVVAAGLRAAGIAVVWVIGGSSLLSFGSGLAVSAVLTLLVVRTWLIYPGTETETLPRVNMKVLFKESAPFALSSLTWNNFTELPKILLALTTGPAAVGLYAAGARFLTAAVVPLQSLLLAITPRLFAFAGGDRKTPDTAAHPLLTAIGLGTLASSALAAAVLGLAAFLPALLGEEYRPAVPILRVLALSLPFFALAFVAGDWLGGVGQQRVRFLLTLMTALLGVPVLTVASRVAGSYGAALGYTSLTALLAVATAIASRRYLHR